MMWNRGMDGRLLPQLGHHNANDKGEMHMYTHIRTLIFAACDLRQRPPDASLCAGAGVRELPTASIAR